jgi:hypothetical protein
LAVVEERNRLVVLAFAILDDQSMLDIEGVDGQRSRTAISAGIAYEPWEAMLSTRVLAKDFIAAVDDPALVSVPTHPARLAVRTDSLDAMP